MPATSTLNFDPSEYAIANGTIMPLGNGGQVCVSVGTVNSLPSSAHVILDVSGYVTSSGLVKLPMLGTPRRVVDARLSSGPISSGASRCFPLPGLAGIPSNATGVVLNVTAVGYAAHGWVTLYPNGQPLPATSTLNFDPSEYAIANNVIVGIGGGAVCASVGTVDSVPGSSQVVLEAVGYLVP